MKRVPLRRSTGEAKTSVPLLKTRKCANCSTPFRPFSSLVKWCGPACGAELGLKRLGEVKAKQAADERRETRALKEARKTIPQLIEEAQSVFNLYIRLRDRGRGCISCGASLRLEGLGGGHDCGHYRSRGAAGHLRFHEHNAAGQCKRCNRRLGGNVAAFRIGLVRRIGVQRLEELENNNEPMKWTREYLREIHAKYKLLAKELEKQC